MREDESHFWMDGSFHRAALQGKSSDQSLEYLNSDNSQDSLPALSSLPVSPSAPCVSKTSSFLEYSQLGRLSVGWQDSPDIVALFLSGQLDNYESCASNVSFFDNDNEALFIPPEFEMKTSFMFVKDKSSPDICKCGEVLSECNTSPVITESLNKQFNPSSCCEKCHKISLPQLKETLEQLNTDLKMSSAIDSTECSQEVVNRMDIENSYAHDSSLGSQMEGVGMKEHSCTNVSEFSNVVVTGSNVIRGPVQENLFSTTIISAPEIADSSTQLPFSPLPREQDDNAKPKIPCKETVYDIDSPSSLHTASTPSKTSKSNYSKGICQQQHFTPTPQSSSGRFERSSGNATRCDPKDKFPYIDQSTVNPFDSCTDSLQMPTVSPSLFKEVISPHSMSERSADFRWSIEQMALLNPAHIELTSPQSYCDSPHDSEYERRAQEAIEKFFSRRCVLPSPWTNSVPKSRFTDQSDRCKYSLIPNPLHTPRSADSRSGGQPFTSPSFAKYSLKSHSSVSVACQTNLSFPAVLPPHVESLLALHSQSTEVNTSDSVTDPEDFTTLNNTSLRRRLLFSSEEGMSSSPSLKNSGKILDENSSEVMSRESHSSTTESVENNNTAILTEPSLDSTVVPAVPFLKRSPPNGCSELRCISPIIGGLQQSPVDFEFGFKGSRFGLKDAPCYGPMCSLSPIENNGEQGGSLANRNPVLPSPPPLSPIKFNSSSWHSACLKCKQWDCCCKNGDIPIRDGDSCELSCESSKGGVTASPSKRSFSKRTAEENQSAACESDVTSSVSSAIESSCLPAVVSSENYDRSSPVNHHPSSVDFKYPLTIIDDSLTLPASKFTETTRLTESSGESCFVSVGQSSYDKSCSDATLPCDTELHSALSVSQGSSAEFHSLEPTTSADGIDELHSFHGRYAEPPAANLSSLSLMSTDAEVSTEPTVKVLTKRLWPVPSSPDR